MVKIKTRPSYMSYWFNILDYNTKYNKKMKNIKICIYNIYKIYTSIYNKHRENGY